MISVHCHHWAATSVALHSGHTHVAWNGRLWGDGLLCWEAELMGPQSYPSHSSGSQDTTAIAPGQPLPLNMSSGFPQGGAPETAAVSSCTFSFNLSRALKLQLPGICSLWLWQRGRIVWEANSWALDHSTRCWGSHETDVRFVPLWKHPSSIGNYKFGVNSSIFFDF